MPHDSAVIATVAVGLGVAFLFGVVAVRLRLSPIVGYLLAGVVVGPFTPGYVTDAGVARQLAEVGVILLMFGVGLHFSLEDLAEARRVVVPGALAQIGITGSVGTAIGHAWGLGWGGAVVLGLSLAVASTVVLLKGLEARDQLDSADGRIAVGWLVVEDVAMVLALVLLPALAPLLRGTPAGDVGGAAAAAAATGPALARSVAAALGKVAVFVGLMFFVGRRAVPWLLAHVARVGSRELFTLAVLVSALGIGAVASAVFGVSYALGAFFAGAVISESALSQRAAADALPLQDAFAVLFFVSVGMLFQPAVLVHSAGRVLALVAVVVVGKTIAGYGVMRALRQTPRSALLMGASIGQIGEFSFIVTALGVSLGLLTTESQALVVAAALIAITVNGPAVATVERLAARLGASAAAAARRSTADATAAAALASGITRSDFSGWLYHVILVGHGRVGATVAEALARAGIRYVVVEERDRVVAGLRRRGESAILGDATRADVLERAGIATARLIVVTAPEPIRARRIIEVARALNPRVAVAVRTHSAAEQAFFEHHLGAPGAPGRSVYAEREAALSLAHYALQELGRSADEADYAIADLRSAPTRPTELFAAMPTSEYEALKRDSGDATAP
ncbi:MAG TPA: cation:proton antiporter [Gemmatimonadaceae bacterium]|nr:cation:proton antiporter [Gemmatimonadaceae bacterium]